MKLNGQVETVGEWCGRVFQAKIEFAFSGY